jgi:hypothetical protein
MLLDNFVTVGNSLVGVGDETPGLVANDTVHVRHGREAHRSNVLQMNKSATRTSTQLKVVHIVVVIRGITGRGLVPCLLIEAIG